MDRRKFLSWVGIGMLATNIPVVLAACSGDNNSSNTSESTITENPTPELDQTPDAEGFIAIGTAQELEQDGFIIDKELGALVVTHNDGSLSALNPECTHQGCTVDWQQESSELNCPCHGSIFTVDGQVTSGPASSPLPSYEVKQEGDLILVKVG